MLVALAGAALLAAPPPATERPGPGGTASATRAVPAVPAATGAESAKPGSGAGGAPGGAAPATFAGKAFDTCEAPPLTVMEAWRGSPYGAVGIYFGGRGRGCPVQKELTPDWVASAHAMGWRLLPLFVGSQAPCVDNPAKRKYAIGGAPTAQGTQEGGDAVRAARALGIGTDSPLYLDVEAYARGTRAAPRPPWPSSGPGTGRCGASATCPASTAAPTRACGTWRRSGGRGRRTCRT
ncbi:glycoside hydrolase domain-containing protein [Streptomyces venezuelae ATCC 10712]